MSSTITGHSAGDHGHILPLRVYFGVAAALMVFTVITYLVAQLDLGAWNMVVALAVAAFKASLVLLYFMHLRYDNRIYAVIFVSSIIFLAIFIAFTMFDTESRGYLSEQKSDPIVAQADLAKARDTYALLFSSPGDAGSPSASGLTDFQIENGIGPVTQKLTMASLDDALATKGEQVFNVKCAACHKLDDRLVGPALREVTVRRTPEFIMNMILNPDEMTHKHPVAMGMVREYFTFMTFQNVTPDDARALLEYFRKSAQEKK